MHMGVGKRECGPFNWPGSSHPGAWSPWLCEHWTVKLGFSSDRIKRLPQECCRDFKTIEMAILSEEKTLLERPKPEFGAHSCVSNYNLFISASRALYTSFPLCSKRGLPWQAGTFIPNSDVKQQQQQQGPMLKAPQRILQNS